ncbi:MAG: relaxase/mobilization nuclease domain-containing protein [Chitinophagaceae bacterium]|nr:relaxase/mobilization nuclease domain-containing protein [Chitinophagaceae bacterium]
MLSKIFLTGKGFVETCGYVCQDLVRAEVLYAEGVRGHDHRLMAEDFKVQHQFWPEKEKPVFHAALTFPRGEVLPDEVMISIAREYLDLIDLRNTQYAVVKHVDKQHLHMHIVANRIDNDGRITGKGLIIERGIKAAERLTEKYHLRQEKGKNLHLTNMEAMHEPDVKRYKLYEAIKRHLPECYRLEDLEKRLLSEGITTRYRNDPVSGEHQGISWRIENYSFAGYRVDKEFTLRRLQQTMSLQQEQVLQLHLSQVKEEQERQRLSVTRERQLGRNEEIRQERHHRHRHSHGLDLGL